MTTQTQERTHEPVTPPQLGFGIAEVAKFYGLPHRKAYYLADKGSLPGVFKLDDGREWVIDFEVARDGIRSRAKRSA